MPFQPVLVLSGEYTAGAQAWEQVDTLGGLTVASPRMWWSFWWTDVTYSRELQVIDCWDWWSVENEDKEEMAGSDGNF